MSRKLTIGMRCCIKPSTSWHHKDGDNEVLLQERSGDSFSFLRLGQQELKKEDPQTVAGGGAWIDEDDLEFVNAKFKANLDFMDWYQGHENDFCADCGVWFPDRGRLDPKTDEDYVCPNENCPGRLYDSGLCPYCKLPAVNKGKTYDECPECEFAFDM